MCTSYYLLYPEKIGIYKNGIIFVKVKILFIESMRIPYVFKKRITHYTKVTMKNKPIVIILRLLC